MAEDGEIKFKQIAEAGPGATVVAVGMKNGQVVLQFPDPVQWAVLDPQTAVMAAEQMARAAYHGRYGHEPPPNEDVLHAEIRKKVTDSLRERMINRAVLILRTGLNKKASEAFMAGEIVDRVLQEVA